MQNLNLYQLERTQQSGLRPAQMLQGLGVVLLLCLGHASWQAWQLHHGAQRLAEKQLQAQQEEAQLASALGSFIEPTLDERLPEELAAREQGNRELQRLVAYLQLLGSQRSAGFVAPLAALTEQHPPSGLWLNGISLREGGGIFVCRGAARTRSCCRHTCSAWGRVPYSAGVSSRVSMCSVVTINCCILTSRPS